MNDSYQQGLGAFDDTDKPSGDWDTIDAVDAGTAALFDTGERYHLTLITGTWTPSRGERSVSIQSHVYDVLTGYCDEDTPLYVIDKDRRSPQVYRFELGQFAPKRCKVYPPRDDVPTITHDQHTRALSEARAEYRTLTDAQREFIRSVEDEIPIRLQV